jgi:hypothetical protein
MSADPTLAARVLIVTDDVADTPALLDAVASRARQGPVLFFVLVPNPAPAEWHPFHPQRRDKVVEAERVLLRTIQHIQEAADGPVRGRVSIRHDPMTAVEEMLHDEIFDEILVATSINPLQRRLHVDLVHRLAHLGLPITVIPRET